MAKVKSKEIVKEVTENEEKVSEKPVIDSKNVYRYYRVDFRLITEMLGTCTSGSLYDEHVLQKAKKKIAEANRLAKRVSKSLEKYQGDQIPEWKEVADLKGVIRAYMQLVGDIVDLPDTVPELLEVATKLDADLEAMISAGEATRATTFMVDEKGWPMISSHMILGNFKENLRIMVNNGDKSILKSKVSVGEVGALDVKWVEPYMRPSHDIIRDKDGNPELLERPIRFERMGKTVTAIAISQQLPAGTTFGTWLRIRRNSPLDDLETLKVLLELGKNNGFGTWRGSGNMGAYYYKVSLDESYKEKIPEGWN